MMNQNVVIRLKSFYHDTLDLAVREIIDVARRSGAVVRGPVPLVTSFALYTVNRSPHVHKSKKQLAIKIHKRLIVIVGAAPNIVHSLANIHLEPGVNFSIELT